MTSLSNRQTLPIRIDGILPSLDNFHMVIWCNLKYTANSLVVMICAKMNSPVWSFESPTSSRVLDSLVVARLPRVKVYFAMIVGWGSEVRKQGKGKRSKTEGWEKRNETKSLFVALSHQPQAPFFAMVLQAPNRTPMSHRKRDSGISIDFSMRMPFRLIFWNLLPKSFTWIG